MKKVLIPLVVLSLVLMYSTPAKAATLNGTMTVSCTVVSGIAITVNNLAFGSVSQSETYDASTTVVVTAPSNGTFYLNVNGGGGVSTAAADSNARTMDDATNDMIYTLYTDSGRTTAWNVEDSTSASGASSISISNGNTTTTVYGRVAVGGSQTTGSYSDSVLVTLIH